MVIIASHYVVLLFDVGPSAIPTDELDDDNDKLDASTVVAIAVAVVAVAGVLTVVLDVLTPARMDGFGSGLSRNISPLESRCDNGNDEGPSLLLDDDDGADIDDVDDDNNNGFAGNGSNATMRP